MPKTQVNHRLLFDQCILCRNACHRHTGICQSCLQDLPWLPHHCTRCALPLSSSLQTLCADCLLKPPAFSLIRAPFSYQFPLDQLVGKIKYSGHASLIAPLALQLALQIQHPTESPGHPFPDLLLPVPMHRHSLAKRGFNQAELICSIVSQQLKLPSDFRRLRKTMETRHQRELDKKARKQNLRHAFECLPLDGLSVALVDDVMTTGTTLNEISRVLLNCGASRVEGWVLARTPEA